MLRCRFHCEGCGDNMKPLEWSHLVGRNNKGIGEPWCSLPELTAGLCTSAFGEIGCHQKIDRAIDTELLAHLRQKALIALILRFGGSHQHLGYSNPLDGIRQVVSELEQAWVWDGQEIVQV